MSISISFPEIKSDHYFRFTPEEQILDAYHFEVYMIPEHRKYIEERDRTPRTKRDDARDLAEDRQEEIDQLLAELKEEVGENWCNYKDEVLIYGMENGYSALKETIEELETRIHNRLYRIVDKIYDRETLEEGVYACLISDYKTILDEYGNPINPKWDEYDNAVLLLDAIGIDISHDRWERMREEKRRKQRKTGTISIMNFHER